MSKKNRKRKTPAAAAEGGSQGLPYHGEKSCQHPAGCRNGGYYAVGSQILCGVHSQKWKATRTALPKNKQAKQRKLTGEMERHLELAERAARENRKHQRAGQLKATKLKMMSKAELTEGYLPVWPNRKHQNKPGFGCASLSPMNLHAHDHGEKLMMMLVPDSDPPQWAEANAGEMELFTAHKFESLPPALSIENFHQFAKVFAHENDAKTNWPKPEFWSMLKKAYADPEPHRHKWDRKLLPKGNPNVPLYSCRSDSKGVWHKFSYVDSRYFYCRMYEKRALATDDFKQLQAKLAQGYNLELVGYDAYPLAKLDADTLYQAYQDGSRPFGHEMVLLSLLALAPAAAPASAGPAPPAPAHAGAPQAAPVEAVNSLLPWHRYRQEHQEVYAAF